MRSLIVVLLIALALPASAGSIRPAACATDPTVEDPGIRVFMRDIVNARTCLRLGLPKGCDDAAAKLKDPTATIWPATQAGYQDYSSTWYCPAVHDHAKQGNTIRNSKIVEDAYLAATPTERAQVDAILKIVTP